MRNAMNEVLRTSYVRDCELGLKRWNRQLERSGIDFRVTLPSSRFDRAIGVWANVRCDLRGESSAPTNLSAAATSGFRRPPIARSCKA